MANILELATEIVAAHASTSTMTKEELLQEIAEVYNRLTELEKAEGGFVDASASVEAQDSGAVKPFIEPISKAFRKDYVLCLICGKKLTTATRHLKTAHGMTPKEYRQAFNIPKDWPLAAKGYSEKRRQMALDRGLADNLAKARAARGKKKSAGK